MFGRLGLMLGSMAVVAGVLAVGAGIALASKSNDDFRSATRVRSLPFAERGLDTTSYTNEAGEPRAQCLHAYEPQFTQTAWYRIDVGPGEAGWYKLDTRGSTYDTVMVLYRATSPDKAFSSLREEICLDDTESPFPRSSRAWFHWRLEEGIYYVRIGDYTYPGLTPPHTLDFTIEPVDGPYNGIPARTNGSGGPIADAPKGGDGTLKRMHNDDIKHATDSRSLPFVQPPLDVTEATLEPGDPSPSCWQAGPVTGTVWYRIEIPPGMAGLYLIQTYGSNFPMRIQLYRSADGTPDLSGLSPVCTPVLEAGTYYLQVGAIEGATPPARQLLSLSVRPWPRNAYP